MRVVTIRQLGASSWGSVRIWTFMSILIGSTLFWGASRHASVMVDGTRYHFLDDDQMISMRYARNLAQGDGAVWNRNERVEGYTNFGWMVVMAGVHWLGAADPVAAIWVRAINWLLLAAVLVLTARVVVRLRIDHIAVAGVLLTLALSTDLLFWSINGFETTLLTALFLCGVLSAIDDAERGMLGAQTCLLAGLLPTVRSDAVDLTLAVLVVAVALGARRRWAWLALAVLPLVAHEAFRLAYYGDWLPNTYYLKVAGRPGLSWAGLGNLKGFVATYAVAVVLAAAAVVASTDRRVRVLACVIGLGFARVIVVGPDMFPGFRFLAPYLPLLLIAAGATIARLGHSRRARVVLATVLVAATIFSAGVDGRGRFQDLVSSNGGPVVNTVTGVLVNRFTAQTVRMAVTAAGCISYFGRRDAVDILGKTDRHVARLPAALGSATGHNRFDINWSLRDVPDLVVSAGPYLLAVEADVILKAVRSNPQRDYGAALVLNQTFVREYRDHPVPLPYLLERNALFVHERSPEIARLGAWREPSVERP
jgi:arabinofuranosyltransferase